MDPTEFVNTSDTRLAVSRVITWMTEPKSAEVRKVRRVLSGFTYIVRRLTGVVLLVLLHALRLNLLHN